MSKFKKSVSVLLTLVLMVSLSYFLPLNAAANNGWETLPVPLQNSPYQTNLLVVNNELYSFEKYTTEGIDKFNSQDNVWEEIVSCPELDNRRIELWAAVGDDIYCMLQTIDNKILKYNTVDEVWSVINTSIPQNVRQQDGTLGAWQFGYATTAVYNDKIYFIGGDGFGGGENAQVCFEYNPATNIWTRLANLDDYYFCSLGSALARDGKIYVLGGFGNASQVNGVGLTNDNQFFCYDIAANQWTRLGQYNAPQYCLMFEYNNAITTVKKDGKLYHYNLASGIWELSDAAVNNTDFAINGEDIAVMGDTIYVAKDNYVWRSPDHE